MDARYIGTCGSAIHMNNVAKFYLHVESTATVTILPVCVE